MDDKKVTDIKYKRLDKDPEIKKVTNEMERMVLTVQIIYLDLLAKME